MGGPRDVGHARWPPLPGSSGRSARRSGAAARAHHRAAAAQPHARAVPVAERAQVRAVPQRVEPDLRALRRPRRHRPGAGGPRIRPQRHGPLARQRPWPLSVPPPQLAGAEPDVAGSHRGLQPDDAGAVLRGVSLDPLDHVWQLHPGAVGASLGRRQRRPDDDQRRAPGRHDAAGAVPDGLEVRAGPAERRAHPLPRPLPDLRHPLVPLRRDGVRQYRHGAADQGRRGAGAHLRHAHDPRDSDGRDHPAHQADRHARCSASTRR